MPNGDPVGLVASPELRCGHLVGPWQHSVCGCRGTHIGEDRRTGFIGLFCELHAGPHCVPVPDPVTIRLITIASEITLAGVSRDRTVAQAEAVGQLERVAAVVGGRLAISRVTSDYARYYATARAVGRA